MSEDTCPNARDLLEEKSTDTVGCRSCAVSVLISWYLDELDANAPELAKELRDAVMGDETPDNVESIVTKMDEIRERVTDEGLRARLCEFNATFEANM